MFPLDESYYRLKVINDEWLEKVLWLFVIFLCLQHKIYCYRTRVGSWNPAIVGNESIIIN